MEFGLKILICFCIELESLQFSLRLQLTRSILQTVDFLTSIGFADWSVF
jgi:hypothetical protein